MCNDGDDNGEGGNDSDDESKEGNDGDDGGERGNDGDDESEEVGVDTANISNEEDDYKFVEGPFFLQHENCAAFKHPNGVYGMGLQRFYDKSPGELFAEIFETTCNYTARCSNIKAVEFDKPDIQYYDILQVIGVEAMMSIVKLPDLRSYWYPEGIQTKLEFVMPDLNKIMTYARFLEIRDCLRFEDYGSVTEEDK